MNSNTVIFTSFFSANPHPQSDVHVIGIKPDGTVGSDFSYIEKWYNSVSSLGLQARIFYDNLSQELVDKYSTDKIQFVKVSNTENWSNNDFRFFAYEEYLSRHVFDAIFTCDCSDVVIKQDPSKLFEQFPDKKFFTCEDSIRLVQFPYLQWHISHSLDKYEWFHQNANRLALINAGVIGARYDDMVTFLGQLNGLRRTLGNPSFNGDMWGVSFVLRYYWEESDLLIGYPCCSAFKSYQTDRTDVFFVHK